MRGIKSDQKEAKKLDFVQKNELKLLKEIMLVNILLLVRLRTKYMLVHIPKEHVHISQITNEARDAISGVMSPFTYTQNSSPSL